MFDEVECKYLLHGLIMVEADIKEGLDETKEALDVELGKRRKDQEIIDSIYMAIETYKRELDIIAGLRIKLDIKDVIN